MGNLVLHPLEYKEHQRQHQNVLNQALSPQGVVKNQSPNIDRDLEVKDTFSKLHPLSGVRNSVIKATLRQSKHLKHTQS